MALAELQAVLARLYTDPVFRERFRTQPQQLSQEWGLTSSEMAHLQSLSDERLDFFAASLQQKRLRAVRKLLPQTAGLLGPAFDAQFQTFAAGYVPSGIHKHPLDALQFAAFLQAQKHHLPPQPIYFATLLDYEALQLKLNHAPQNFHWRRFQYPVWNLEALKLEKTMPPLICLWFRRQARHPWKQIRFVAPSPLQWVLLGAFLLCLLAMGWFPDFFQLG